ncbi:MAG: MFS transporter [Gemmatimonadetes bacterium]|nr:MFS transporter [Gemmatimonadota bacterium]
MSYQRPFVFAAACMGMLMFGVSLLVIGPMLPGIAERFALDGTARGALVSLLPFGLLAGSLIFGPVVDRFGYRPLLMASAVLVVGGLEALAFAPTVGGVRAAVFAIGLGGGLLNGGTNALVADISSGERGAQLSLLGVFFGVGALGMPVLLGALQGVPAELVLSRLGIVLLAPVLYFAMIAFPPPKHAQGFPLAQGARLLRDGGLLLIAFTLALQSGVEGVVNNWTTTYLQEARGASSSAALWSLSAYVAGMTLARLALASALRRLPGRRAILLGIGVATVGILLLAALPGTSGRAAALVLVGAGLAVGFPVFIGYVADLFPALTGTALSVVLTIALPGNMALNYLMGVLSDVAGPAMMPAFLAACLVAEFALAWVALRVYQRRVGAAAAPAPPTA